MALVFADRVKEGSNTAGTGALTLTGAAAGFQSFSAIGNANTTYYTIYEQDTGGWEVGIGTYTSVGTSLARNTVLSSSNAGALVVFTTADKEVFVTYPAERAVYKNSANTYTVQQTFDALTANSVTTTSAALTSGTIATAPTGNADIANKAYVDLMTSTGISIHTPVKYESPITTGNLTAAYLNGGTTPTWTTITGGTTLDTASAHGLSANDVIVFGSTTNGLTAGTPYFVFSVPTGTSITLSLNYNGAEITTLTNGTGLTITSLANSGIGATLTNAGTKAALVIDGITVSASDRILIYSQTNAFENGIYTVTTVGTPDPGGTNWVLTRALDADTYAPNSTVALGQGDYFFVQAGNTGKGESYVLTTVGTIVFGTTNLLFNQFASSQVYSAGTGLTLTDTTFSISNTGTAGTYGTASQVPVFITNAQGQVTSATNTNIAIASGAVSGLAASATTDTTNAANITSGTLPSGRLIGGYTQVTAVGTLTAGTWNADTIGVAYGGTGLSTTTAYSIVFTGTTSTGAFQASSGPGTAGQILTSNGAGALPTFQTSTAVSKSYVQAMGILNGL